MILFLAMLVLALAGTVSSVVCVVITKRYVLQRQDYMAWQVSQEIEIAKLRDIIHRTGIAIEQRNKKESEFH